jgi:ankyrin repeat protein
MAQLLIDRGTNIKATPSFNAIFDITKLRPLELAVSNGHKVVARLLIDNSADIKARDWNECRLEGKTPL